MLRSNLCDYSDAYIVVKRTITIGRDDNNKKWNKKLTFKNNVPVRSCISKTNNTLIDNVENLNVVMSMYNLLEYSNNYSMISGSLWNYYRDEINDDANENAINNRINNNKKITSKFFEYKTKIMESTSNDNNTLDTKVVVPLKWFE